MVNFPLGGKKKDCLQSQSLWYSHTAMYYTRPFVRVSLAEELREYSRDFSVTHCLSYMHLHFSYLCYQYILPFIPWGSSCLTKS